MRGLGAGALLVLLLPATAQAQALETSQLAGGKTRVGGRTLAVTGGYVDPRTGRGRVEHRGLTIALGRRNVRRVRTSGPTTRVVARTRLGTARMRLRLTHLIFEGGTISVRVDPALGLEVSGGTFRITGGRVAVRTHLGEIGSRGVMFVGGVDLRDPAVMPGVALEALVGDFRPAIATLSRPLLEVRGLEVTIGPSAGRLTAIAVDRLNTRLETDRFREGMPFGTVTVRGRLRG